MKRLLVLASAFALAVPGPLALSAPAAAQRATDGVAFCRDVVLPNVPQATLGECLSYSRTGNLEVPGFAAHECDAFLEIDPEGFYLVFDSYSDCVREYPDS